MTLSTPQIAKLLYMAKSHVTGGSDALPSKNAGWKGRKGRLKPTAMFSIAAILALAVVAPRVPGHSLPSPVNGSWQVDSRHSYAEIITDGTTDFGKKKIDVTLGFARLNGQMQLDATDPVKSRVDFRIYPANSMAPPIGEDGKVTTQWLANLANHTLVCFHSKRITRMPDGKVQATGDLTLTRVDRNIDATPSEAYAGPVYGPPMIHRVSHEATFIFDLSVPAGQVQKPGALHASTSTKVFREDFPQLARAVVSAYWPPLIEDRNCEAPAGTGEAYSGQKCTGTFLMSPGPPESPYTRPGEDYPGPQGFNAVIGERVAFQIQMDLLPQTSREQRGSGN